MGVAVLSALVFVLHKFSLTLLSSVVGGLGVSQTFKHLVHLV